MANGCTISARFRKEHRFIALHRYALQRGDTHGIHCHVDDPAAALAEELAEAKVALAVLGDEAILHGHVVVVAAAVLPLDHGHYDLD
jgi:hypothetical protein